MEFNFLLFCFECHWSPALNFDARPTDKLFRRSPIFQTVSFSYNNSLSQYLRVLCRYFSIKTTSGECFFYQWVTYEFPNMTLFHRLAPWNGNFHEYFLTLICSDNRITRSLILTTKARARDSTLGTIVVYQGFIKIIVENAELLIYMFAIGRNWT